MGPVEISDRDRPFFLNRRKRVLFYFGPATRRQLARMQGSQKKLQKAALAQLTSSVFAICRWPNAGTDRDANGDSILEKLDMSGPVGRCQTWHHHLGWDSMGN